MKSVVNIELPVYSIFTQRVKMKLSLFCPFRLRQGYGRTSRVDDFAASAVFCATRHSYYSRMLNQLMDGFDGSLISSVKDLLSKSLLREEAKTKNRISLQAVKCAVKVSPPRWQQLHD